MVTRNAAHAVPLCAALLVSLASGCTSQQMLAVKDRDIRDLRQQNASRQEALVKSLKNLESVRAELEAMRYERRELEQEVARAGASIGLLQQTVDRLEAQKAKLQEELRQSEISYERLRHTYQDIKAVLSNTVTELAQTRRDHVATTEGPTSELAEHSRLRRKVDELRSQLIRERAARRAAEMDGAPPRAAAPREDSSPWVWRLTEEPPEVETAEPGTLVADERDQPKVADSASDKPDVLGTAFIWTLGAVPAIGLTLLMFIVLVRVLSRPGPDTRERNAESSPVHDEEHETEEPPVVDEHEAGDAVEDQPPAEDEDDRAIAPRGRSLPVEGRATEPVEPVESVEPVEEKTRPIDARRSDSSEQREESPAETAFIDSLDWLEETAQPPMRRRKHTQDTEAVQMPPEPSAAESRDRRGSGLLDSVPEPRKHRHETRETGDVSSDTQMIGKIEEDEVRLTQVLPFLEVGADDDGNPDATDLDGSRGGAFSETAVLDAASVREAGSETARESRDLDEVATDTQVLPPLLDFEDDSELDEALAVTDEAEGSADQDEDEDEELLAELEDLVGEKFEEPVL